MKKTLFPILMAFSFCMAVVFSVIAEVTHEQIEEVMKKGMKGKMFKELGKNKAKLKEYFTLLAEYKPPKGDAGSWKKKTGALLAAVEKNDQAALNKAANCKACHSAHKK